MTRTICLNADIGELPGEAGRAMDRAILDIVSRCSIACGGHAGDDESMRATLKAASARNVVIGAHPSYQDLENFGRRSLKLSREELSTSLRQQLRSFSGLARAQGVAIDHVKPHGALYNDAAQDESLAEIVIGVTHEFRIRAMVGPPNSALAKMAKEYGIEFLTEGFADRRYAGDGSLVPRSEQRAVLENTDEQVAQVIALIEHGVVTTANGDQIDMSVKTICLHGDSSGAVETALALREALGQRGIDIQAQTA